MIQVQKADLAGKYLCIDNSGIPAMKLNIFSCFFSLHPMELLSLYLYMGSLTALKCPLIDLDNTGLWRGLLSTGFQDKPHYHYFLRTVSEAQSLGRNRELRCSVTDGGSASLLQKVSAKGG